MPRGFLNTLFLYLLLLLFLLSYYLPSSNVVDNYENISKYKYVITSDINFLKKSDLKKVFVSVKKFDNHFLLMNIR